MLDLVPLLMCTYSATLNSQGYNEIAMAAKVQDIMAGLGVWSGRGGNPWNRTSPHPILLLTRVAIRIKDPVIAPTEYPTETTR